ncbi:MAG: MBL fold metallo-hydrolase [Bacteroidetes bacterium]|nr:MBL fold metallo-hydrolase [Bacteroidota bacterium]
MIRLFILSFFIFFIFGCELDTSKPIQKELPKGSFLTVLGIAQDAGFPQANCQKECCEIVWKHKHERNMVSCIAIVDSDSHRGWMFDATPDFKDQLFDLENVSGSERIDLGGIFLTHAHMGHYTGLMHLGREAMGAKNVPVFAMPRMKDYLENNGPWSQLVDLKNIEIQRLKNDSTIILNENIQVTPLRVPHRDEFSETVGYRIRGKEKTALFIPDIDKWHLWERDILEEIRKVDYAFLDGSFYQNGEIKGRDMSQIPHPFLEESMDLFKDLPKEEKSKIYFIHFNHTNPVLQKDSEVKNHILKMGYQIAYEGQVIPM